jgi:hypothetical protein
MEQKPNNKAKRWFAWLGGGVIILCLAAGGFWYWINIPPQIKIPTPVMPKPNGYDYFIRAGAAYVEDSKGVDELTDRHDPVPGKTKQYPIAAKEAWLRQNAKAFQFLREGLKYPALHSPVRSGDSSIKYGKFRDLARALMVESHVRAARGDWPGAAGSALDSLEFAYDLQRGGPLIAGLVGNAVQAISLREMYHISPHLNASAARQAAQRIEHLYAGRFPYFKTLQEEKWAHQAEMLEMMNEKNWRFKLVPELSYPSRVIALLQWLAAASKSSSHSPLNYSPPSWFDTAKELLKYSKLFFISNKTLMKNYNRTMNTYISNGHMAYRKSQPIPTSGDPLTQLSAYVLKDTRWNWARMNAYSVLDMTMLALRAFRIEKGHYPANLKELAPGYLKSIPLDPFTDAPLHYQLQGNKYLLWSVGPDGINNNGIPIFNNSGKYNGSAKYRLLEPDSKGDVVAGVNLP